MTRDTSVSNDSELPRTTSSPPRQILLFFDGTANSAAYGRWSDMTNVFRMNLALYSADNHIVSYMAGVGTRGDKMAIATARGMDEIIREAYVNLASNCLEHDEIIIFGYSRGGAAALGLVDILSRVGLLWPDDLDRLHAVWDWYLGRRGRKVLTPEEKAALWDEHIKGRVKAGANKPKIRLLGLFDPVPGNDWDTRTHFSQVRFQQPMLLDDQVDVAVSILSIDDDRNPSFRPVLLAEAENGRPKAIEQIWMPGVHADIGGNADGTFLSDVALLTMIERAKHYCKNLIWDDVYIDRLKDQLGKDVPAAISNERSDLKTKVLPKASRHVGSRPRLGQRATAGEKLHQVYYCLKERKTWIRSKWQKYAPKNVPPSGMQPFSSNDDKLFQEACERALTNTISQ